MGSGKIVALVLMMSMIASMVVGDEDHENCYRDVFNECVGRRGAALSDECNIEAAQACDPMPVCCGNPNRINN
jgi:hypothetical protein